MTRVSDVLCRPPAIVRRRGDGGGWVQSAVLLAPLLVPIDFDRVDHTVKTTYLAIVGLAAAIALFRCARQDAPQLKLLLGILVVSIVPLSQHDGRQNALLLIGLFLAGSVVGRNLRRPLYLGLATFGAVSISLLIEKALQSHLYERLFEGPRFVYFTSDVFRSRGIIGQPVPSADICVTLAAVIWYLCGSLPTKTRRLSRLGIALTLIFDLEATGTRSALLIALVLASLGGLFLANRIPAVMRVLVVALLAIVVTFAITGGSATSGTGADGRASRLLDFGSLNSSTSYIVRSNALNVVSAAPNPCGLVCTLGGHGNRALQNLLVNGGQDIQGLSTIDNFYVTAYWDYGVIGVLALLLLALRSVWRLGADRSLLSCGIQMGIISILLGSFFSDELYLSVPIFLLGLLLSLDMDHRLGYMGQDAN